QVSSTRQRLGGGTLLRTRRSVLTRPLHSQRGRRSKTVSEISPRVFSRTSFPAHMRAVLSPLAGMTVGRCCLVVRLVAGFLGRVRAVTTFSGRYILVVRFCPSRWRVANSWSVP